MARTQTQQAAIDSLRATKAAAQDAVVKSVEVVKEVISPAPKLTAPTTESDETFNMRQIMSSMIASAMSDMKPSKRGIAAFFAGVVATTGVSITIAKLAAVAVIAVTLFTGSVMLGYLIIILSMILSIYASIKAYEKTANYVLSGQIDRDIVAAKNKVLGFFKKAPLTVASA